MKASLQKETRLLLPAWGLAMAAAVLPACLPNATPSGIALPCFAVGALLLALAPFGQEISLGTFSLLLSQPQTRLRLWQTKLTSAALAMLSVWGVLAVLWLARTHGSPVGRNLVEGGALASLVALTGALWTTLLFRQNIAAFWASLLIPWLVCTLCPAPYDRILEATPASAVALPLIVYAAAGLVFARWLLLRAQDLPWTGGVISFARLRPGTWSFSLLTPQKRLRPWLALLQKEIALQQVTLFLVLCLAALHLLALVARMINPAFAKASLPISSVWILWLAMPLVIGSVAVAEERRLNTMTGVLCLPVQRFRQFLIKFILVVVAGVILGAAVPWALEDFGQIFGARNELLNWTGRPSLLLTAASIAIVSFFASSLARNSLHALGTAFVLSGAFFSFVFEGRSRMLAMSSSSGSHMLGAALIPVALAALVWPAYANFKRIDLHFAWLSSLIVWVVTVIVMLAAALGISFRPWELLLPLEPRHGQARIELSSHPRVCATSSRVFVLLADGRLWQSPIVESATHRYFSGLDGKFSFRRIGIGRLMALSGFVPGTNWVDLAAGFYGALAIQSDHSLWSLFETSEPGLFRDLALRQVDFGSDWKSVAAAESGDHYFAMKQDGTLWRLDGPLQRPLAISSGGGWINIFGTTYGELIAVKQDGSVWCWVREDARKGGPWCAASELPFKGTNWVSFTRLGSIIGLDSTGEIWDDHHLRYPGWRALAGDWSGVGLVDATGHLWRVGDKREPQPILKHRRTVRPTSKYSDWLSVTGGDFSIIALAEDGTLSSWHTLIPWETQTPLLVPTRKPEWSINLFAHPASAAQEH